MQFLHNFCIFFLAFTVKLQYNADVPGQGEQKKAKNINKKGT